MISYIKTRTRKDIITKKMRAEANCHYETLVLHTIKFDTWQKILTRNEKRIVVQ